ncbi:unnamed protein product [Sphenostylis stenocarpa]|uniref:Uncharacterized protein n=1 Tax=Sphenostylis stenocarpa TaxID=92480 RepID=A0AA86SNT0_9FABA|nr:unnamed protein product [Sphenostylis stenocarpa]
MDFTGMLRDMLADMEAQEADLNSYNNHGEGSQNISGRKNNSGEKSGDRTIYNITYNVRHSPKKKTPPRNKSSDMRFDIDRSLALRSNTGGAIVNANGNLMVNRCVMR